MAKQIKTTLTLDNKQYNKAIKQSQKQTKDFEKSSVDSANAVRNAFIALGGGAVINSIVQTGAEFQQLENSLNVVFGSVDAGAAAFERVQQFATQTQFDVQTLTQAFVQLKGAGVEPTEELLMTFADTASVTTDQMGTFQAALDLVSRSTAGGLGLEDLNRLADRGIPVFTILQEKLGLARLEVSEFGKTAEGANRVVSALLEGMREGFGGALANQAGLINFELGNLKIAMDNLKLALFETFGEDAAQGIKALADAINNLAKNTDAIVSLMKVLGGLLTVFLSFGAVRGITKVMDGFENKLRKVFTRMGDGRIKAKGLREAFRGLRLESKSSKFDDLTKGLTGTNAKIAETGKSLFTFTGGLATFGRTLLRTVGYVGIALTAFEALRFVYRLIVGPVDEATEAIKNNAHVLAFQAEQERIAAEEKEKLRKQTEILKIETDAYTKELEKLNKEKEKSNEIFDQNDPLSNYMAFLKDLISSSRDAVIEQDNASRAVANLTQMYEDGFLAKSVYIEAMERINSILGNTSENAKTFADTLNEVKDAIEAGTGGITQYNLLLDTLKQFLADEKISFTEFTALVRDLDESFMQNEGLNNFIDLLGTATTSLSKDLATAFLEGQNAGEAFKGFFKKMITQIIADIMRLLILQPLIQAVMGAFGMPGTFGAGGKFTLTPRANGGPVMSNKPYLVGERGPELFVPGGSGNIVPNGQMGGTAVTYNINAVDSQSFQMALAKDPSFVFAVTEAGRRKQPGRI